MRVKTKNIDGTLCLVYRYGIGPDISFEFYSLAEVGEPYQEKAKQEAERTAAFWGKTIHFGLDINSPPWVVDALI